MDHHPLFVYGTLRRGQPNHTLLQGRTERTLPGWMEGVELYSLSSYPMMVEGQGRVLGEVVYLRPDPGVYVSTLDLLDRVEGADGEAGLYMRVLRPAFLASGEETLAWAYLGQPVMVRGWPQVKDGDWPSFLASG